MAAALYSALAHDRVEAALQFGMHVGGDTNTVAAMPGAVAGARGGYRAIPTRWLEALEDGHRWRSYVQALSTRLIRGRIGAVQHRSMRREVSSFRPGRRLSAPGSVSG